MGIDSSEGDRRRSSVTSAIAEKLHAVEPSKTVGGAFVAATTSVDSVNFSDTESEDATTFATGGVSKSYYKPQDNWEGIHRFDPSYAWEPAEEHRLVRKIDWRICTFACFMFFALQLDRGNISQALSDDMLKNLGLNTNDYNYGMSIFYVSFLVAELPSQMISKKLGPDRWIPVQMVCWSLVASMQAFLKGKTSFFITRFLLGICEGGFIPDVILYLSYFYTSQELPKRLSWFWVAYQSTQIVSAFLAYGILRLGGPKDAKGVSTPGLDGLYGWQWLFALEGLLTGCIGILAWFYLPSSPYTTASWFRGKKGWFDEHEEKILANRIIRDDPSKGDMHNRQALSLSMLWECLKDYHMWPIYLIGLSWSIPAVPLTAYLTLELKAIGFGTFETNLLTIPAYVLFILQLLFWTWLSEKINQRILLGLASQIWVLPVLIALEAMPAGTSHWARWACSTLIVGYPYVHAILVAITSRNAGAVRTRTVASALYNMHVQAASVIGINIYRNYDKPLYRVGNGALIAIAVYNIALIIWTKWFYVTINKRRDAKWRAMTQEEREHYLATTTDAGNKRLDFRFAS